MRTRDGSNLDSSQIEAVRKKISALYKQEKFGECIRECNNAIKQGYQDASLYNTKAIALLQLGEHERAKKSIDIAVRLAPDNAHYAKNKESITAKIEEVQVKSDEEENIVPAQNQHQETEATPPDQPSSSNESEDGPSSHVIIIKSELDPAEEIRRYKAMLDNGIIDQQYFETKKQQLQNL
ncbi:MAG: hypothetical protein FWF19_05595 [Euryarchaeota archaeon]|nr:hypothetical protein [Euryarchaeota archaeon]